MCSWKITIENNDFKPVMSVVTFSRILLRVRIRKGNSDWLISL